MFDERETVTRILNGDMGAFESLVKQYERLVYVVVSRLVPGQEDVEDICQEVFIKVYNSLFRFGFQSKLSTWIARIAYFTGVNYIKKYKKQILTNSPDDIENYHFTNDNPELLLTKKDAAKYIEQLVLQLPEKYRTLITLFHINEFSYEEISEITGMPEGTIKNYLFRARKLLKEKIEIHLKGEQI
jgi:RNA polymerase sigma-70 factor (ECF subfamily)